MALDEENLTPLHALTEEGKKEYQRLLDYEVIHEILMVRKMIIYG